MAATTLPSLAAFGLLLTGATTGVFLAGGPPQGSLGIFLFCAGAALTFCPPPTRVAWPLWFAAAALVGCGALALLPESWFGVPGWRRMLEAAPAIHLASTVTPVPWETGFWLALLALSSLVGLFCLAHPIRSTPLLACAAFGAAACGIYAALAMYAKWSGWRYPFDGGATFGFFPNRNHTATLLVSGSILSTGLLGVVWRARRLGAGLLAAASLSLCVAALFFFSASRGGVVFLIAGLLLWTAGLGRAHRNPRLLVSMAALAAAAALLFLVSGSEVRNRLLGTAASDHLAPARMNLPTPVDGAIPEHPAAREGSEVSADFRWLIYRDTRALIRDFPITGTGLGTFACDFAHYRNASLAEAAPIHPESDWLMLIAEAGMPALLCAAALLWLAARPIAGLTAHPFWPLRWGCIVAAGAAVLHGMVDVPMHRIALGWWLLVVAGLGLQVNATHPKPRSRSQRALFILGGLTALALGAQLIRAEWFGGPALPPFAAAQAQHEIVATFDRGDAFGAMNLAGRAAKISPMSAPIYHLWGVLLLHFEDSDREVEEAFAAERLLNPTWPEVPLRQGDAWVVVDPKRAADVWLDALARERRIARDPGGSSENSLKFYRALLVRARRWPVASMELAAAARSPAYVLAWMQETDPAAVKNRLGQVLAPEEMLRLFSPGERQQLLLLWYAKGNRENLEQFVGGHPDWRESLWPVHLQQLTEAQRYEDAVREAAEHYAISLALLPSGTSATAPDAAETGDVMTTFERYWRTGNTITARRVLAEAADSMADSPAVAEYWRLRLALAAQDANWTLAWQHLRRYLQVTRPTEMISP